MPAEESPLEVRQAPLSFDYSSPLDLLRKHELTNLNYNPFAPPAFSTRTTVWSLDPILTEQMKLVQQVMKEHTGTNPERINGLFGDAIKWLLKNVGVKAVDWLSQKGHELIDDKQKKLTDWANTKGLPIDYEFEMSRNADDSDIEENPGPDIMTMMNEDDTPES